VEPVNLQHKQAFQIGQALPGIWSPARDPPTKRTSKYKEDMARDKCRVFLRPDLLILLRGPDYLFNP
jgi:hypothetical protein